MKIRHIYFTKNRLRSVSNKNGLLFERVAGSDGEADPTHVCIYAIMKHRFNLDWDHARATRHGYQPFFSCKLWASDAELSPCTMSLPKVIII